MYPLVTSRHGSLSYSTTQTAADSRETQAADWLQTPKEPADIGNKPLKPIVVVVC